MTKTVETPSGKGAGDENFPVGSWLLPAGLRPHVMAFYDVVRAADDIADHGELTSEEKLGRLHLFERALDGDREALSLLPKVGILRESLDATGVSDRHARDLLEAFKQDATRKRYETWRDLLGYCALSASPVGRFLLDLHGESADLYPLSDPLCDALQVLNHLQDCRDDFLSLDRVYLPKDSFAAAGIDVAELAGPSAGPGLRRVLDDALDGCGGLLERAADLPRRMRSRRLAAETAIILGIARRLTGKLRREDPLATRVELSKPGFMLTAMIGLGRLQWLRRAGRKDGSARVERGRAMSDAHAMMDPGGGQALDGDVLAGARAHVKRLVERSGSSFYWGMRLLPKPKREAMFAIYAFCREVDDIADSDRPAPEKQRALDGWRDELDALFAGRPARATSIALLEPIARFDLPKAEFQLMIDGMAMDAREAVPAPSMSELERYCRAVAGTVGLLSMSVFGQRGRDLDRGALALAEALQLTNILRDLHEDAGRDRLYLPRELLGQYGMAKELPEAVVRHPDLKGVCRALASRADKAFALADRLLARGDRRALRPALIMMHVYRRLLDRLIARDWRHPEKRVRLGKLERLRIAIRHGWF